MNKKITEEGITVDKQKGKVPVLLIVGAIVFVLLIVIGFGFGRIFTGNDDTESKSDDSNVVVPEGAGQEEDEEEQAISVDDHDALVSASKNETVEGIDFSGDSADLYLVVSAPDGSEYSITTYSTDENGQRITNEKRDLTEPTTVLTAEQTGLHLKEGVTVIDEPDAQHHCNRMFGVGQSTTPDDPGCAYGASFIRSGQPTEEDKIVVVMIDGTGTVLDNDEVWTSPKEVFFTNEGGKVVRKNE